MNKKPNIIILAYSAFLAIPLWGCTPEIGSDKWCANLKEKPSSDWTMNEATDYAKHCIMK